MAPHATFDPHNADIPGREPFVNRTHGIPGTPTSETSSSAAGFESISEPIAIIGMGCRLPGDVRSASELWTFLRNKRSGQGEVPPTRWNIDSFYHPNGNDRGGSINMRGGYFINEDLRNFENDFFGINNLEATFMDPQQRKLLEVVFECLESAGVSLEDVSGANVGTYVGSFTTDFWIMQARDPEYWNRYNATGMGTTILANRISHIFNLKGPSFVLDTACSSSLYGLHLACAALDAGECESAIVAAANLIQSPEQHIGTMKAGVLSPTGTCHTFDASADGYGRADGVGALYLKKLSKAIADGDPIRSVIRGTAINSNGRTNGITLPSSDGQEAVIRKAYQKAGLMDVVSHTNYVECHGTGTAVGDPIELEAVSRVFRRDGSSAQQPLLVGSVKTNLGHSEAASGISSIIKATLALEKASIPATIGIKTINPKINPEKLGVQIVTEQTDFPKSSARTHHGNLTKRVGINSFGYGGANSHAIIDAAEGYVPIASDDSSEVLAQAGSKFLIPLSASSIDALDNQAKNIANWVDPAKTNIVDLAYTLASRRSKLSKRGFTLATQHTMQEDLSPERFTKTGMGTFSKLPIAFVFTGQGAQWPQMGKELIMQSQFFRNSIQELDAVLQTLPEQPAWTLQQAILDPKETSKIGHVTRSQPVCTAIQVAYVQLLARWGINPVACIGHSSGEIGAAYAAGRLTAAQAIVVAYYRGYVVGKSNNPTPGGMMAAGLSKQASDAEIEKLGLVGVIRTACVNSPESVTISGDAVGIEKIMAELQGRGVFARKLNTDGRAYHSHHMSLIGQEYQDLLETALASLPSPQIENDVRWISSVYGGQHVTGKVMPAYWRKNLESPVLFSDAVEGMVKGQKLHLVELGPHSALELPVKQTRTKLGLTDSDIHYNSALSRGNDAIDCVLRLMGHLYLHGHDIDFANVNYVETAQATGPQGKVVKDLPPASWNYVGMLWNEGRASQEFRHRKYPHHDLIGSKVLGGNGANFEWRKMLQVKDIPWVEGHKLGNEVVFPAAGYLAMAIEAVSQVAGVTKADKPSFDVRNVTIAKALQVPSDANSNGIEVFTSLQPALGSTDAKKWYDFSIISFDNGKSNNHAQGLISIEADAVPITHKYPSDSIDLEPLATRNWYNWFQKVGLNFGETFQTMKKIETHRKKKVMHARSQVPFLQGGGAGKTQQSDYVIHPITIDTMFQSAIIASTAGVMKNLTCKVPTHIEAARFKAPSSNEEGKMWTVDAISQPLGFSGILVAGEVHDTLGEVCAQVENVTAIQFQGAGQEMTDDERHPMLRVTWKPDIGKLQPSDSEAVTRYVNSTASTSPDEDADVTLRRVAAVVDLIAHKDPRCKILEIGSVLDLQITRYLLKTLRADTAFKRYGMYSRGYLSETNDFMVEDIATFASLSENLDKTKAQKDRSYNLVIAPPQSVEEYAFKRVDSTMDLVAEGGYVMAFLPTEVALPTKRAATVFEIPLPDIGAKIYLGKKLPKEEAKKPSKQHNILVVERAGNEAFNDVLIAALSKRFCSGSVDSVDRISLHKLLPNTIKPKATVISTVELNAPILSTLTDSESISVKAMTDNATNLIWLTGGNNLKGEKPDMALVSGLSRALMLEQPSLRFFTMDVDQPSQNFDNTAENVLKVVEEARNVDVPEFETVMHKGLSYTSRFGPEETLNETFRNKQNEYAIAKPLGSSKPAQLTIGQVGAFDSLMFNQTIASSDELDADAVEVDVKAVALNSKDVAVFSGKEPRNNTTCSSECAGVVTNVGVNVANFQPGDRVVVMAPGHFATLEAFPEWACEKLDEAEDFSAVSTLPTAFATALYALEHRANLREGEMVLIQHGVEDLGVAAIQIAKMKDAEVFATVETEDDREFLVKNFDLKAENVILTEGGSLLSAIVKATQGRGVDVIVNSTSGKALHESWDCLSGFGRFVEIGGRALKDAGKLDMQTFPRNATFTSFALSELCDPRMKRLYSSLLSDVMALYREGKIRVFTPVKFDASEVSNAFKSSGAANTRLAKTVVSFEDEESMINVLPLRYDSQLSPEKWYLMIGCLGGLGRSMSKWMVKQGARKFVFLGRSGIDRPAARNLVEDLEQSGAMVKVVRGDVVQYEHVAECVNVVDGEIGGVIQAAMGLNEALWTSMSNQFWHTGIDPKIIGTWNLHNAIKGKDANLDFFLMTSSISGSVGTATESNYCAANYFLDVFARYRRAQGRPATSVGLGMISEVGYLHENPEIEALLLRKGIQAINEDELLQIIDCAIAQSGMTTSVPNADPLAVSHILTGLEPHGIKKMRAQGFDANNPTLGDPRASLLAASLDGESDAALKNNAGLPAELAAALETGDQAQVVDACVGLIIKRFSNLVLIPADKIDVVKPLNKFGMDSMLAAEFRTWFYQAFKVDVPFLTMLNEETTLKGLGELVAGQVAES